MLILSVGEVEPINGEHGVFVPSGGRRETRFCVDPKGGIYGHPIEESFTCLTLQSKNPRSRPTTLQSVL